MPLPAILQPYAKRKVRVVAGYGDAELWALADIANTGPTFKGCKIWWDDSWKEFLQSVDTCEISIEDWTAQLEASRVKPCT